MRWFSILTCVLLAEFTMFLDIGHTVCMINKEKSTISGTLAYEKMQYFLVAERISYHVLYDEANQGDQLGKMVGENIDLFGDISTAKNGSKRINISNSKQKYGSQKAPNKSAVLKVANENGIPVIRWNGRMIYKSQGGFDLEIEKVIDAGSYKLAVICDITGPCPASYRIISLFPTILTTFPKNLEIAAIPPA